MQSTTQLLRGTYRYDRNAYVAEGEPMIFHCHHYNVYLQAVIEDTSTYLPVYPMLADSAQEIVHTQFSQYFAAHPEFSVEERKDICQEYFRFCGFGIIDLSNTTAKGGEVVSPSEHYAIGWKAKFGLRDKNKKGVGFFANGYVTGAVEAVFDLPLGTLIGKQTSCISQGATQSLFQLSERNDDEALIPSPQEGKYQTYQLKQPSNTKVDYEGIRQALTHLPLEGDSQTGLINAFGVLLTRMYANYYCLISHKLLRIFEQQMGRDGIPLAAQLLTEAGHVCAFNTFGGIMQSTEWNAMIKPMLQNKEDWIHGITAIVNALGWGFWEIIKLEPQKELHMKVVSGYESNNYLAHFAESSEIPISFLAAGGTAGIMNLVYNTSITEEFITLDEELYKRLNRNPNYFRTEEQLCRVKHRAEYDQFNVR